MKTCIIRAARPDDRANLVAAIIDFQDYERRLHDTRLPGSAMAEPYLDWLTELTKSDEGAFLIAEQDGIFAGYAACVVSQEDNLAETADSNRFGLVMDTYVIPSFRGQGIAAHLLAATETHLIGRGVSRIRIGVLANNDSAIKAYTKFGFMDYEMTLEKKVAR